MHRLWILLLPLIGCAAPPPPASPPAPVSAEPAPPAPEAVAQLPPLPLSPQAERALQAAVGDARVVLLGESSHGAGNAFAWRAAIVELLRRELGFEHLVIESSFYDCRRAYQRAQQHRDPVRLGRECAFDIWAEARETDPLWRSVVQGPMQLWGMDPQLSGDVDAWLIDDMQELARSRLPSHDAALLKRTLAAIRDDTIERTQQEHEAGRALLLQLSDSLDASERQGFWGHTLDSLIATEQDYWLYQQSGGIIDPTQHNLRERQMAANLLWVLEQAPQGRFVVWLHNAHAARNVGALGIVDHGDHQHDFRESVSLGDLVTEALDPAPLIVAMFSTEGRWALAGEDKSGKVPPQPPHDVGERLGNHGLDRALIDLRSASRLPSWLVRPLAAPILGMEPTIAVWPRHVDVLLFERAMTPATARPGDLGR